MTSLKVAHQVLLRAHHQFRARVFHWTPGGLTCMELPHLVHGQRAHFFASELRVSAVTTHIKLAELRFLGDPLPSFCHEPVCTEAHDAFAVSWAHHTWPTSDPLCLLLGLPASSLLELLPYRCMHCHKPAQRLCTCATVAYCSDACQAKDAVHHHAICPQHGRKYPVTRYTPRPVADAVVHAIPISE